MSERERIIAAAYKVRGCIIATETPGRHHTIVAAFADAVRGLPRGCSGFMTSQGRYVGRHRAYRIAEAAGQLKPRQPGGYDGPELFSEDVW